MLTVARVTGPGTGAPAASRPGVVGTAAGAVTVLGAARALSVGAAARPVPVVGTTAPAFGITGPFAVGAAASALGARASFGAGAGLGRAGPASGFGFVVPPEAAFVLGVGTATPTGTFFPGRALGPAPSAVTARTVVRAVGPATAAVGTPSSFGTHVVLDCLSRPVGLTIPWWKRGTVPLGDRWFATCRGIPARVRAGVACLHRYACRSRLDKETPT